MPYPSRRVTWFDRAWTPAELLDHKGERTVSVVLPALNEERTVGEVVASVRPLLGGLVDELLVIDSGSTDDTARVARAAGATVYTREQALPTVTLHPGKGEVLWRSLAVASGDIIVFIDADLRAPSPKFVPTLLAPLLFDPQLRLVKGFYRRPLNTGGTDEADGGGRVTQLVARPLLTALAPSLADVLQPLGGEYAGTRELLTSIPFAPGYGVEIGILMDTWQRFGADAIGQVDLGVRIHRNRTTPELAVMSRQIIATMLDRLGILDSGRGLMQYLPVGDSWQPVLSALSLQDRPPMENLLGPAGPYVVDPVPPISMERVG